MAKEAVLIVEDDEDIRELLTYNLHKEGFAVTLAGSGEDALKIARSDSPHLVLLDLMLPGMDGLEVCKLLKCDSRLRSIPVVMITAKGEEADVVRGLELGADDYIAKPFSTKVLLARVKAVLRRRERGAADDEAVIRIRDFTIHPGRREVLVRNDPIELTYTEFSILQLLAQSPGWVFTRNRILDAVRGLEAEVTDRSVDFQIMGLRRKLGPFGKEIETVRGVGYRLKE